MLFKLDDVYKPTFAFAESTIKLTGRSYNFKNSDLLSQ